MLRGIASIFSIVGVLHIAVPAQACVKVTPTVRAWAQCGYKVASETGDHKFMVNFAKAKALDHKVLRTAKPRWAKLEPRLVKRCGTYARAAAEDQKNFEALRKSLGAIYVPEDQFEAIWGTGNISILVKPNA
jgi:hypothetical protein